MVENIIKLRTKLNIDRLANLEELFEGNIYTEHDNYIRRLLRQGTVSTVPETRAYDDFGL